MEENLKSPLPPLQRGANLIDEMNIQETSSPAGYEQQSAPAPAAAQMPDVQHVQQMAADEIIKVQNLVRAGVLHPLKGQNLMNNIVQTALNIVTINEGYNTPSEPVYPDFFNQDGRNEVLEYLKKSNVVNKDEISQITALVEKIEQNAISRHLRQQEHEKTLNDENEAAKRKLTTNVQKSGSGELQSGVFTREQIGRMSGAEFAKNERLIMEQLRKGQIR
jgi:hypothetical protein